MREVQDADEYLFMWRKELACGVGTDLLTHSLYTLFFFSHQFSIHSIEFQDVAAVLSYCVVHK